MLSCCLVCWCLLLLPPRLLLWPPLRTLHLGCSMHMTKGSRQHGIHIGRAITRRNTHGLNHHEADH